jgi:hypothetical protein
MRNIKKEVSLVWLFVFACSIPLVSFFKFISSSFLDIPLLSPTKFAAFMQKTAEEDTDIEKVTQNLSEQDGNDEEDENKEEIVSETPKKSKKASAKVLLDV